VAAADLPQEEEGRSEASRRARDRDEDRDLRDLGRQGSFLSGGQPPMGFVVRSVPSAGLVVSSVVRPRRDRARSMRVVASMGSSCYRPLRGGSGGGTHERSVITALHP
jgi:hypothetical protein